jgi:TonB family protein
MRRVCLAVMSLFALTSPAKGAEDGLRPVQTHADLDASVLSKAPRLLSKVAPEYPRAALAKGAEAEIKLLIDVDDKGQVSAATVLEAKGGAGLGFEDASILAAYQLAFEPAEIEGKPVAVQIAYTFRFVPPRPKEMDNARTATTTTTTTTTGTTTATATTTTMGAGGRAEVRSFGGILRERGTRQPMRGVLVTVYRDEVTPPVGFECTSDDGGRFAFFDLAEGTWKVAIELPGYYPFATTEDMKPGERVEATYFIERQSYNPFDVMVEAPRPRKEVSRVVIDSEVIEKTPGAMGDALTALQNYAGVARVPTFEGELIVRGSAPKDSKVFVDGAEIPIAYHFGGLRSVVPTGMIANLDFYPGNFSSYYSRAIGGVIDVTLKKPKGERWNGYVDVNLLDSGFFVEAPVTSKLTLSASARRSYVDAILNAVIPDDAPLRITQAPVYYDYQFMANYRPAPAHDLRLFVFGSDDKLAMVFKNAGSLGAGLDGNRQSIAMGFDRVMASYRYVPGEHFENALRLSVGRDGVDEVVAQFVEHLHMDSVQIRDTARLRLSEVFTVVGGVDGILQHWTATVRMPMPSREGEDRSDVDLTQTHEAVVDEYHWLPGGFAGLEIQPTSKLLLLPSLRFDYYSKVKDTTVAPRLSARYAVNDLLTLKGAVGVYHQEPAVEESNADFGNPLLKTERAIHYAAGVEVKPSSGISMDVTGFYKALDHLVSETSATRMENGREIPLRLDNNGEGRVVGMEVVLRREPIHRLSGWVAYTLSRSERRDSGATDYRLFQYDQTHILTAVGMWRFGHNWQLGTRFRLVSGNPSTPVTGAVLDMDAGIYKPTYGAKYASRNPMFAQWDLRIDKKWVFNRFLLDAYLDVQNVTNRANVDAPDYNFDYRKTKTTNAMPIYPILGLRAEL